MHSKSKPSEHRKKPSPLDTYNLGHQYDCLYHRHHGRHQNCYHHNCHHSYHHYFRNHRSSVSRLLGAQKAERRFRTQSGERNIRYTALKQTFLAISTTTASATTSADANATATGTALLY
jgi:hypothetical protein